MTAAVWLTACLLLQRSLTVRVLWRDRWCATSPGQLNGSQRADVLTSSLTVSSDGSQDASNAAQLSGGVQQVGSIPSALRVAAVVMLCAAVLWAWTAVPCR